MGKIIRNNINTPMGIVVKAILCCPTCERQSHKAVSITTTFDEKGEPNSLSITLLLGQTAHTYPWPGCALTIFIGGWAAVNTPSIARSVTQRWWIAHMAVAVALTVTHLSHSTAVTHLSHSTAVTHLSHSTAVTHLSHSTAVTHLSHSTTVTHLSHSTTIIHRSHSTTVTHLIQLPHKVGVQSTLQ